MTTAFRI